MLPDSNNISPSHSNNIPPSPTQHSHSPNIQSSKMMRAFEIISAVALAAFSAYKQIKLFVPAFLVGMVMGIYSQASADHCNDCHNKEKKNPGSSCALSLLEQLTGARLPVPVSIGANIAITVCHIDHHATVFVPVVGVSIGAWVGKSFASLSCWNFSSAAPTQATLL